MSYSSNNEPRKKRNLFNPGVWLTDFTPRFFDYSLDKLGLKSFKWLVVLILLISAPLIITPVELWQQAAMSEQKKSNHPNKLPTITICLWCG